MFQQYCSDTEPDHVMACLKNYKHNSDFDKGCKAVMMTRQIIRNKGLSLLYLSIDLPRAFDVLVINKKMFKALDVQDYRDLPEAFDMMALNLLALDTLHEKFIVFL